MDLGPRALTRLAGSDAMDCIDLVGILCMVSGKLSTDLSTGVVNSWLFVALIT